MLATNTGNELHTHMTHNRVILSVVLVVSVIVLVVILRGMGSVPIAILRGVFAPNVRSIFIPDKKNLPMTFTPQAPDGNWAEPWQNACEETDIVMVDHFYRGEPLTPEKAKTDIVHIFSVKEQRFGVSKNESVDRMVEIINAAGLTWKARVVPGPTIEAMQQEIVQGRPVIVPVDARLLFNPYYSNITPEYHTLVLSGYDVAAKKFIVQDSGTDKGANFTYGFDELMTAMHDFAARRLNDFDPVELRREDHLL